MNETLSTACDRVFRYPTTPPPRKHGPCGYSDYQAYKPWLRDEYAFRCLYCLWRERWQPDGQHDFGVDHVQPQATEPGQRPDYHNLVYACNMCNSTRRNVLLPIDPSNDWPGRHLHMLADGTVEAVDPLGTDLIELCPLNRPLLVAARLRIVKLIGVLRNSDEPEAMEALHDLLALPSDIPNLAALHPPDGNTRSEGIVDSFFERRLRNEIPDIY